MKKFLLISIMLVTILFLPFTVNAKDKKVTVYLFRGATCPHCEKALEFFKTLLKDKEYKGMFEVRHLEIWKDKENSKIADDVAVAMGHEPLNGEVPYIVIGNYTFEGYGSSKDEEIKKAIKETYEDDSFVDNIKDIVGKKGEILNNSEWLVSIVIIVAVGAILGFIIFLAKEK